MAIITITKEVAEELYNTRSLSNYARKTAKKSIIARIKSMNGIPASTKIGINILGVDNPKYLQVYNKRTKQPLTNSLPDPVIAIAASPVAAPVAAVAEAVAAVAAKKAAPVKKAPVATTKKTPAVKATPAPAKKPAAKAPAKPVVKAVAKPTPAAKAASAVTLGSPTKTGKYTIEVRVQLNGKRTRLGYASSEKMKNQMIANAKA